MNVLCSPSWNKFFSQKNFAIFYAFFEAASYFAGTLKLFRLNDPLSIDADGPVDGAGESGVFDNPNDHVFFEVHTDSEADSYDEYKRKPVRADNKPEWEGEHYKHTRNMDQLLRQWQFPW